MPGGAGMQISWEKYCFNKIFNKRGEIMEKAIYKIENKINHKVYIGQSTNPEKRFKQHCQNAKYRSLIHEAIVKYGKDNFSFLQPVPYIPSPESCRHCLQHCHGEAAVQSHGRQFSSDIPGNSHCTGSSDKPAPDAPQNPANPVCISSGNRIFWCTDRSGYNFLPVCMLWT
jgi:hypothetical protein